MPLPTGYLGVPHRPSISQIPPYASPVSRLPQPINNYNLRPTAPFGMPPAPSAMAPQPASAQRFAYPPPPLWMPSPMGIMPPMMAPMAPPMPAPIIVVPPPPASSEPSISNAKLDSLHEEFWSRAKDLSGQATRQGLVSNILGFGIKALIVLGFMGFIGNRVSQNLKNTQKEQQSALEKLLLGQKGNGSDDFNEVQVNDVKLSDVQGIEPFKDQIEDLIYQLKHPNDNPMKAKPPKGILFHGPAGTGKTYLARAIAAESGVPFIAADGSNFINKFVGQGASRVRELFDKAGKIAKEKGSCIIFIDEIDSLGSKQQGLSTGEYDQTLNQLLTCMQGFNSPPGVVVIGATNGKQDDLEPRFFSRFSKAFEFKMPVTSEERLAILEVLIAPKEVAPGSSLKFLADKTNSYSGRDLEQIADEARQLANKRLRTARGFEPPQITNEDLEKALKNIATKKTAGKKTVGFQQPS